MAEVVVGRLPAANKDCGVSYPSILTASDVRPAGKTLPLVERDRPLEAGDDLVVIKALGISRPACLEQGSLQGTAVAADVSLQTHDRGWRPRELALARSGP